MGAVWEPPEGSASPVAPGEWRPAFERAVCRMCPARVIPTACAKEPADGTTIAMHPWPPLNDQQLALLTRIEDGTDPVTSDSPELPYGPRAQGAAPDHHAQAEWEVAGGDH